MYHTCVHTNFLVAILQSICIYAVRYTHVNHLHLDWHRWWVVCLRTLQEYHLVCHPFIKEGIAKLASAYATWNFTPALSITSNLNLKSFQHQLANVQVLFIKPMLHCSRSWFMGMGSCPSFKKNYSRSTAKTTARHPRCSVLYIHSDIEKNLHQYLMGFRVSFVCFCNNMYLI